MRAVLLAGFATACVFAGDACATVYRVSFSGGSSFAYSYPSGAGVTYNAPRGDNATTTGSYTFDTADPSATSDGKGGKFYLGSVGSVTVSNLVNLPAASYTFTSPRIVLDVSGATVGTGISVSLAPGLTANTTDLVWIDTGHFEVRHAEPNGYELNEFSTVITGIAQVLAVPEPASLELLAIGLVAGAVAAASRSRAAT